MNQFVGADALAELVWSPRAGLNIKLAEEKPYFMWEVGPSDMEFYNCENAKNEEHITSHTTCHVTEKVASCPGSRNQGTPDESYKHLFEDRMTTVRSPLKVEKDAMKMEKDGCFSDPFLENAQVESHGSIESCRNTNFLTTKKRKCIFEQRLILGSKRIKNQLNGTSFINWISNTLKGFKNHNVYDPSVGVWDGSCSVGQLSQTYVVDTIRKLQLSRTEILKWMNSRSMVAHLDGFFLRLRVAKRKEGEGKSRYLVACITGSQEETPWNELKHSIRVKVGDNEFLVQSQYVSNCDFLEVSGQLVAPQPLLNCKSNPLNCFGVVFSTKVFVFNRF
ncbi:hypothetical protein R6Q59_015114 [Mikania micrantha]